MGRALRIVAVAFVALATVAWWLYPANRTNRELRAFDVPPTFHLAKERPARGFLCLDSCPDGTRYWVVDGDAAAAEDAVRVTLVDRGYRVALNRCPSSLGCRYEGPAYSVTRVRSAGHGTHGAFTVDVSVGTRSDGRTAVQLTVRGPGLG